MGATTITVVRGHIVCFVCRDEVEEFNLAQEAGDENSLKYLLLCNSCMNMIDGTSYRVNTTPIPKEAN
jgi:uncharacterized CHY-type Zn-finger protein